MSDKVNGQAYVINYKKVVQETTEMTYRREEELKRKLQEEKSPLKYIELNAVLAEVKQLREYIHGTFEYCRKPVEVKEIQDE